MIFFVYTVNLDVRDIEWVAERTVGFENTEVSATGKVVQIE